MKSLVYIILAIVLVIILIILAKYNKIIKQKNRIDRERANIGIYLNKRFDLIPNIVECVKGYSNHEEGTLEKITSLRSKYNEKSNMVLKDANEMNNELTKYLAVVEAYPDLKANTQYLNLQVQLREIENQLENARKSYNSAVNNYNTTIEVVPSNLVAAMFGFKKEELFQVDEDKRENINIKI